MYTPTVHQLEADLDRVLNHAKHLRQLDPSVETERQQALAKSLRLLGALSRYRHLLKQIEDWAGIPNRQAA